MTNFKDAFKGTDNPALRLFYFQRQEPMLFSARVFHAEIIDFHGDDNLLFVDVAGRGLVGLRTLPGLLNSDAHESEGEGKCD